jgi:hypothetical protein
MNGGWLLFFTVVFVVIWGVIFYRKYDKIENNRIFIILLYFIPVITALKFSCAKNPIDFLVYGYKIPAKEEGKKIFLKILKEKEEIFDYQQEPVIWTKVDKIERSVSYEVVFKKNRGQLLCRNYIFRPITFLGWDYKKRKFYKVQLRNRTEE